MARRLTKADMLKAAQDAIARAIERHLAGAGQAAIERQGILAELGKLETELVPPG